MGTDTTRDWLHERLLVVRCQAGDDSAFEELVTLFTPRLTYYVERFIGANHSAEDVLQAVWCDVYTHLSRLRRIGSFRSWLYRIAHDHAVRELRALKKWPRGLDAALSASVARDDKLSFAAEEAEVIHRLIGRLPLGQREALVLHFLEGMSYKEIADAVGCPVGTVRSRIHYGKAALRTMVEKEEERG
jgi:RNA polymerase sigma-70 factor (ECF subfamily)